MNSNQLPMTRPLTPAYRLSLVVAVQMFGISLASLLLPSIIYPVEELRQNFLTNDAINLIIGVPILLGSMWLTRNNHLTGLLLWPGALFYSLYNYMAYVFSIPFSGVTFIYLSLVLPCTYAIYDLLARIDQEVVKGRLAGVVPVKSSGWVLVVLGALFLIRAISRITPAMTGHASLSLAESGVLIADLLLSMAWIAGGALLLRRKPLGYTSGLGLLFGGSMLFISLVLFLLLQPLFTDAPFLPVDVGVVLGMGLIMFIPFGLFLRGTRSREKST